jgi:hypothetical protein
LEGFGLDGSDFALFVIASSRLLGEEDLPHLRSWEGNNLEGLGEYERELEKERVLEQELLNGCGRQLVSS